MSRMMAALGCVLLVALASVATPRVSRAQNCYECDNNDSAGTRCRVVAVGQFACWEDSQGCHVGGGTCTHPQRPPIADTMRSTLLERYTASHVSLRRSGNGHLFLLYDAGTVSMPHTDAAGKLLLDLCDGRQELFSEWLDKARQVERRRTIALAVEPAPIL